MVEGKRQLGFLYNDFSTNTLDKAQLKSIIQSAIIYCLDFDLLVPGYDIVKEVSVRDINQIIDDSRIRTGKRLGFVFNSNSDKVD